MYLIHAATVIIIILKSQRLECEKQDIIITLILVICCLLAFLCLWVVS